MHRSGIALSQSDKEQIAKSKGDDSCRYMKIEIKDEKFVIKGTGKKAGSDSDDFKAMAAELEANVACYLIFREFDPKVASKWVLCQYMPDSAMVNSKMLYASSRASLKEGFGASALTDDYFISDASEMTLDAFTKERTVVEDQQDLMTFNERAKSAAVRAEMSAMSESVQLTVADVPIKTSGEAKTAIENVKDGSNNLATLILETKTQELRADTANCLGNGSMEDVSKICTAQKEARFLLFRYEHKNPSGESKSTMVFMYYCPDEAPPRMKMMYSTCKSMVLRILEKLEVTVDSKFEASTAQELTDRAMLDDLYPKKTKKAVFKKPKARSKRRLMSKKKFQAA